MIRVVGYNITVDFFDGKDPNHAWIKRYPAFFKLFKNVDADIYALQELSPDQALQIYLHFKDEYDAVFLSQTPSDVDAGTIVFNEHVGKWCGKFMGTMILGFFYKKSLQLLDSGRFWFNENPFELPIHRDRSQTDKGFGNFNTYRAVFWLCLSFPTTSCDRKPIYVFNSHYPLSGNNETRLKCAQLENKLIRQIAGENTWFSMGDRNLLPNDKHITPDQVYVELVRDFHDVRDSNNHFGFDTTWAGFEYDQFKNVISPEGHFVNHDVLDVLFSNRKSFISFHHPGNFISHDCDITVLDLDSKIVSRNFTSDHLMVGGDYLLN